MGLSVGRSDAAVRRDGRTGNVGISVVKSCNQSDESALFADVVLRECSRALHRAGLAVLPFELGEAATKRESKWGCLINS